MKVKSITTMSEFENYEEFLNCIKIGKKVMRKSSSTMGMHFNETQMKYDNEKDCFYYDVFINGEKSHRMTLPVKTADDFKKESNSDVLGLNHPERIEDIYPLSNFYLLEKTEN